MQETKNISNSILFWGEVGLSAIVGTYTIINVQVQLIVLNS